MTLSEFREKALNFLVPIVIVVLVLWGLIVFIGKAYFWDVSELSLQFAEGSNQMVRVEVQARIVYFDADLFWFYYPVHITFPRSYEQECAQKCTFSRLPAGDAVITVFSDELPIRARVLILPDTVGELDFRPPFQIIPINDEEVNANFRVISDEEKKLLTGTIEYTSRTQGIVLLRNNRENIVYDLTTQQTAILPSSDRPTHIARGEQLGSYLIWDAAGVTLWDRYGRTPTQILPELTYRGYTMTWQAKETTITRDNGKQILSWYWSPLFTGEKMYITDGQEVREIQ